jgi:hypothetical protein
MTFNKNKNHIYDKSYSTYIIIRYNDKVDRKQGKLHVTPYIAIYYAQVILGFVGASSIAFFKKQSAKKKTFFTPRPAHDPGARVKNKKKMKDNMQPSIY